MGLTGSDLVARALQRQGVDTFFYLMGAPMLSVEAAALALGLRGIDVRHEQAAAMAAHAYARLLNRPGVCMAASGPGTANLVTGVAHAWADGTPVVALGGSAPANESGRGAFQEIDQVAMMAPCTKWAERVHEARRIPEMIDRAIRTAMAASRGRSISTCPATCSSPRSTRRRVDWPAPWDPAARPRPAPPRRRSRRSSRCSRRRSGRWSSPGSGLFWSDAEAAFRALRRGGGHSRSTPRRRAAARSPRTIRSPILSARSLAFPRRT